MPLVEYVLLAILGSTPIAPGPSNSISPRTYGAESVAQPSGGVPSAAHSSRLDKSTSNSNKKATTDNKNGKKPAEKSKKGSGGTTTTPPPK